MDLKLWRVVERFCREKVLDPEAFGAFAQLVEEDHEETIRKRLRRWSQNDRAQFSFLMSGVLDTVDDPQHPKGVLQCQGLYLTGTEASLRALGAQEIPQAVRVTLAESLGGLLADQVRIIIGSRIVPVTWVHGFSWKQWRAALAREGSMFSRPCKAQPSQAPESQGWILPVFVEKADLMAELEADVLETGVSAVGKKLALALARVFRKMHGDVPPDVSIHPILAAAHCCWTNAKMIAVYEWARAIQKSAQSAGQTIILEEGPRRGSVRVKDGRTKRVLATLKAEASFPVDGTGMALESLINS
jgi:hypothetical protein